MSTTSHPVDLFTAWGWDCPVCGVRNLVNGVLVYDDGDDGGQWVSVPDGVTCLRCFHSFPVRDPEDV